jgi:hypothetical protein
MEYYVGNTDLEWFNFLKNRAPEDINFWQPGGKPQASLLIIVYQYNCIIFARLHR